MIDKDMTDETFNNWDNEGTAKQIKTKKARRAIGKDAQLRQFIILDRLPAQLFKRLENNGYIYNENNEWVKK